MEEHKAVKLHDTMRSTKSTIKSRIGATMARKCARSHEDIAYPNPGFFGGDIEGNLVQIWRRVS